MLAKLRAAGFQVATDGEHLWVHPAEALTDELRVAIRAHKPEILAALAQERVERQHALESAKDGAGITHYREALTLGRLHLCANCAHFAFGPSPASLGRCAAFDEQLVPFAMPFSCSAFIASPTPVAPECLPDPGGALAGARGIDTRR